MASPSASPPCSGDRVSLGERRWAESDGESSSARSYCEVARSPAAPLRLAAAAPEAAGPATATATVAGKLPAKDRLGPRSEVHRVGREVTLDADGFQHPRRKHPRRPRRTPAPSPPCPRSPSPEEVAGLCFRCLDRYHRVRDCTNDVRCRRCLIPGHVSRDCETHLRAKPVPLPAAAPRAAPARQAAAPPPPAPTPAAPMAAGPVPARIIMARSVEMEEAEVVLSRALVATIAGTRPRVTPEDVAGEMYRSFQLEEGDFTVHSHHPEDFLIIFGSQHSMDRLRGEHFVRGLHFTLTLRPWSKLAHAGCGAFEYRVELELRGIPAHAWHLATAEHILGPSVWIERLHPHTRSRADLGVFRLSGRAHDPSLIRRSGELEIVELIPSGSTSVAPSVRTLIYPFTVALSRSEVDRVVARSAGDSADPGDGSGGAGTGNDRPLAQGLAAPAAAAASAAGRPCKWHGNRHPRLAHGRPCASSRRGGRL
uniref:CCHC-type domain-containing protein n=1 Tax=Hordeum vulgare subsp. vulgare TaxID=112509 RepID=A0A8I6X189_HORVV